jgi:hypothetical protein
MRQKTINEVKEKIESIMEFGGIPKFVVVKSQKHLYVCRNNGQFHKGDCCNIPGFATFIGKFTADEAENEFLWMREG